MADSARMRGRAGIALLALVGACETELDESMFQRRAEKVFTEVNPGFGIVRRKGAESTFVRGDQIYVLDTEPLYEDYAEGGKATSRWFERWQQKLEEEAARRRRPLEEAKAEVIPILKSGTWIRVQDLGAIGPKRVQDKIRPWRHEVAKDLFLLLAIPEELLGYRYASFEEVATSATRSDEWTRRAVENLRARVGTSTSTELRGDDGRLLVHDFSGVDLISAQILDPQFRARMLQQYGKPELGAAVASRDVLIVFDASDVVAVKPIRARTHELYDVRNHPCFRGLLRFDRDTISILEPAQPEKKKPGS